MDGIMSLIEQTSSSSNVTDVSQIDANIMQEFLMKVPIWDFFEIGKDEFTRKSENDKQQLIIRYYNSLQSGIFCCYFFFFWFNNNKSLSSTVSSSFCRYIIVCS